MAQLTLTVKDERNFYHTELTDFQQACEDAGTEVDVTSPPKALIQFADPSSLIIITFDPQAIRMIFEYAAALVVLYKATDYLGEFFKATVKKLGEISGAKIAEALSSLWHGTYNRVRAVDAARQHTRVYFACHTSIAGTTIEIDNSIFPSHIEDWSEEDITNAYWLMILRVFPILREFATAFHKHGLKVDKLHAMVWYPKDSFGYWFWSINAYPVGKFIVGPDGQLKTLYELPFVKKKHLDQLEIKDINTIVQAYVEDSNPSPTKPRFLKRLFSFLTKKE